MLDKVNGRNITIVIIQSIINCKLSRLNKRNYRCISRVNALSKIAELFLTIGNDFKSLSQRIIQDSRTFLTIGNDFKPLTVAENTPS